MIEDRASFMSHQRNHVR